MNQYQPRSTRIDAWFLSIGALVSAALALGCSGSDGRGQEKGGAKKGIAPDTTVSVRTAAFSPDGKLLVIATAPGGGGGGFPADLPQQRAMQLWDVETGTLLHTFWLEKTARDVLFLAGGKKILTSDYSSITIFDVAKRAVDGRYLRDGRVLATMPDGKQLLVYTDTQATKALEVWGAFTAKALRKFSTEINPGLTGTISPDGKWALVPCIAHATKTGQVDPTIMQLWDLSKGEVEFSLVGLQKEEEVSFQLWDRKGNVKVSFGADNPISGPVLFSPDSKFFVAQHSDGEGARKKGFSLRLCDIRTMKLIRTLGQFSEGVQLMGFSKDGKELVLITDEHMRRLQFQDGKQLWSVALSYEDRSFSVFSPDATRLCLGGGITYSSLKGNEVDTLRLEIWDAVHGKKLRNLTRERP
jgi:WD40 repeat protein